MFVTMVLSATFDVVVEYENVHVASVVVCYDGGIIAEGDKDVKGFSNFFESGWCNWSIIEFIEFSTIDIWGMRD
jgi:hypothetical protein